MRPAAPADDGSFRVKVRAEQIRTVYLHSPTTTLGSLVAGAFLVWMAWDKVSVGVIASWSAALLLHQAVRVYHYGAYLRANPGPAESERWGRLYVGAAIIAGLIWGSSGIFFYIPDALVQQTYLAFILFSIVSLTIPSISIFAPAFYPLVVLVLAPFMVRCLASGNKHEIALAIPLGIALVIGLMFGRKVNLLVDEAIRRRFENVELIDALSRQKEIAEAARAQAEAANRSKTHFFAAANHDLRQPLHALGLMAAALSERSRDPGVTGLVASINASVEALEELFNELLDISKLDAGAVKPELRDFPVSRVLDRLRLELAPEAAEKGLRLRVMRSRAWVRSDPVLLERILRNLISNAIRYTAHGGVLAGARRRGGALALEVWDSGVGIPESERGRIFEEFYQLGNAGRASRKGLGLGLAIIQRLCQLLGYRVRVDSRPGRGSVFRFEVPAIAPVPEVPQARAHPTRPRGELSGRLVVVIDDDPAIVEGMRSLLATWGVHVLGSSDGEDVMRELERLGRLPDLLIVDYRLAGERLGTEVIDELRAVLDPEIPAIVVTGSTTPDLAERIRARGDDLLAKPVLPADLRARINARLRSHAGR
jgi:signal transduction histidine kinase/CheY-like chemotaxis protein